MSEPGFLTRAAGLVDVEHTDESIGKITEEATCFLLAGGSISPEQWSRLDVAERSALATAGASIVERRALASANALLTLLTTATDADVARLMVAEGLQQVHDEHATDAPGG